MAPPGRPKRKATSSAPAGDAPPKKRTRGGVKAGSRAVAGTESRATENAAKKTSATSKTRRAKKVVSPTDTDSNRNAPHGTLPLSASNDGSEIVNQREAAAGSRVVTTVNVHREASEPSTGTMEGADEQEIQLVPQKMTSSQNTDGGSITDDGTRRWLEVNTVRSNQLQRANPVLGPATCIASAIEDRLNAMHEPSAGDGNSRLVNRLRLTERLPTFSGDPLEWLHFKDAYVSSAALGDYSDRENIMRLYSALKGEAREAVSVMLATMRDPNRVIRALELEFGNKNLIAEKMANDIKKLPSLNSEKISLTQFATKLRNAVSTFKDAYLVGYLHSPDLLKSVGNKMPSALKYSYNNYVSNSSHAVSTLERVSDFLDRQAELAIAGGLFGFERAPAPLTSQPHSSRRTERPTRTAVAYTIEHSGSPEDNLVIGGKNKKQCVYCQRSGHNLTNCRNFACQTIERRWTLVKQYRVCFQCLQTGHMSLNCASPNCGICKEKHHTVLHFSKRVVDNRRASRIDETPQRSLVNNHSREDTSPVSKDM